MLSVVNSNVLCLKKVEEEEDMQLKNAQKCTKFIILRVLQHNILLWFVLLGHYTGIGAMYCDYCV